MQIKLIMSKNCLITSVGINSLHQKWIEGRCDFDLHLIVYDDSINNYLSDTPYIVHQCGYKLRNVYNYFLGHPDFLDKYDFFYMPDDDVEMSSSDINAIFEAMRKYNLKIAQPALKMSYFTWNHTQRDRYCRLRYTNFIEMMVPCFSKDALKKILFTFNENETGWGTDFHWHKLINASSTDMAILDEISIVHTRPIQSGQPKHFKELEEYQIKYGLTTNICFYDSELYDNCPFVCDRKSFIEMCALVESWIRTYNHSHKTFGRNGWFGLFEILYSYAQFSESQKLIDELFKLLNTAITKLAAIENDMTYSSGICGCCCLLEQMFQDGILEEGHSILKDVDSHIWRFYIENKSKLNFKELYGIGKYFHTKLQYKFAVGLKNACVDIASRMVYYIFDNKDDLNSETLEAILFIQRCGIDINDLLKTIEMHLHHNCTINMDYVYRDFILYALTNDDFYKIKVCEGLHYIQNQLMTQDDVLKLCKILRYKKNV